MWDILLLSARLGLDGGNSHCIEDVSYGAASAQIIDRLIQPLEYRAYRHRI